MGRRIGFYRAETGRKCWGGGDWKWRIKTKPPRGSSSVAANFLSGSTIDFQAHRGIMDGMESFGRISLFPGLVCPWHLLSFSDLDFNMFLGFGWGICTTVNQNPVNRFSSDVRISSGFQGINGFRLFGFWSTKGFSRLFGLHYGSSGLWINSISQDLGFGVLRILGFWSF